MKEFILDKEHFNEDDWIYCVTSNPGWDVPLKYEIKDDCLCNRCKVKRNPNTGEGKWADKEEVYANSAKDYEFISVISKETFEPNNLLIELDCKFDKFGAPCIVFTHEWYTDAKTGLNVYRRHYEFCAYEGGLNIWDDRHGGNMMLAHSIAKAKFPVEANKRLTIRGELDNGRIIGSIGDKGVNVPFSLNQKVHIGFTACEGINSFYSLRIGKLHD